MSFPLRIVGTSGDSVSPEIDVLEREGTGIQRSGRRRLLAATTTLDRHRSLTVVVVTEGIEADLFLAFDLDHF